MNSKTYTTRGYYACPFNEDHSQRVVQFGLTSFWFYCGFIVAVNCANNARNRFVPRRYRGSLSLVSAFALSTNYDIISDTVSRR